MAQTGAFTMKDGTRTGTIRTMIINVKARLVPDREKTNGAPDFRLCAGGALIGDCQPGSDACRHPIRTRSNVK